MLNKNPEDYFTEVEQAAFGTGVLVDGLDFSDDKMLQGRLFLILIRNVTASEQIIYNCRLTHPKNE